MSTERCMRLAAQSLAHLLAAFMIACSSSPAINQGPDAGVNGQGADGGLDAAAPEPIHPVGANLPFILYQYQGIPWVVGRAGDPRAALDGARAAGINLFRFV